MSCKGEESNSQNIGANTYDRDNDVAILKGEIKIMWFNSIM